MLADRAVDLDRRLVEGPGDATAGLTPLETELLRRLARGGGELVSRRDLLVDVWEYAPDVETRAVDNTVRRLRRKIEADPKKPVHLLSAYGGGYRLSDVGAPPAAPPTAELSNITLDPSTYFGRDDAMERVAAAFEGARLVTLLGPAGMGKTRLARRFAAARVEAGDVPQAWFVDLTGARTEADVAAATARELGAPVGGGAAAVRAVLEGRGPLLLVLDNFEQIVDAAPETVGAWLGLPRLRVLVTSRETLRVRAEAVVALEPLAVDDAAALFLDRARASGRAPGLAADRISPADSAAVRELARRLDGLPLALELAAARAGLVAPARMVEMLGRRFDLLSAGPRGATDRRATLRGALDWSWDTLEPWEQAAFPQLALFRGAFTVDAAEAVLDLPDGSPWALDVVADLRDKSMLRARGDGRFVLLESLRDYGLEKLAAAGAARTARDRHVDWCLRRGEALIEALPGTPEGVRGGLEQVAADVTAAHEHALSVGRSEDAVRLGLVLDPVLSRRDPRGRARLWDATCAAIEEAPPRPRAQAVRLRAETARVAGDQTLAEALCEEAVALAVEAGDRHLEGEALSTWGASALTSGRWEDAADRLGRALIVARQAGDSRLECYVLANVGTLGWMRGRLDDAERGYREGLAAARAGRLPRMEGVILGHLGGLEMQRGRLDSCAASFEEALAVLTTLGDRTSAAVARGNLGAVRMEQGRLDEAEALLRDAEIACRRLIAPTHLAVFLGNRGLARFLAGDPREALALLREAHDAAGEDERVRAYLRCHRAQVRCALDSLEAARADLEAAGEILRALGDGDGLLLVEVSGAAFDLAAARAAERDGDTSSASAARARVDVLVAKVDAPDAAGRPAERSNDLRLARLLLARAP